VAVRRKVVEEGRPDLVDAAHSILLQLERLFRRKPVPDLIGDGHRFADKNKRHSSETIGDASPARVATLLSGVPNAVHKGRIRAPGMAGNRPIR
jgi:hypothetical protein